MRTARCLLTLTILITACSKPRPPWMDEEPDIFDITLNEGVTQATPKQIQQVKVSRTRLTFPKSAVANIEKEFPVGKPLIGGASTETPGNNPFGFMRKVKEVKVEGEEVVVETENAGLEDVVSGKVRATFDPMSAGAVDLPPGFDLSPFFPDFPVGEGQPLTEGQPLRQQSNDFGFIESGINDQVSVSQVFDLKGTLNLFKFQKSRTVGTGAKAVTMNISADGNLVSKWKFTPTLRFEFETTRLTLDYVHVSARGQFHIENSLDLRVGVTAASGTEPTKLVGAAKLLEEGPETGKGISKVIATSGPIQGPIIYGVKTTFRVVLTADCGFGIQASTTAQAKLTMDADMLAGLEYHKGDRGWEALKNFDFTKSASASVTSGGGVAVECGLSSRIEWLVADLGGPYLATRAAIRASAVYQETCNEKAPDDGRPDITTKMQIIPIMEVQTGGVINAFKVLKFEVGPISLYKQEFEPLFKLEKKFPGEGLGYCFVPCANGVKDGLEIDVDCGGPDCHACKAGAACSGGSDCASGSCNTESVCVGGPCEDGARNGTETDIDCGGSTCPPCDVDRGKQCLSNSDCAYGLCSKVIPSLGYKMCTTNLCLDGNLSGSEGDVDCGAAQGCGMLCGAGQKCNSAADCDSGACHATTKVCVESQCVDGSINGSETDVDCGPDCPTKCANGQRCNPLSLDGGKSGCATAICSASRGTCTDDPCGDGRQNAGETDVDCGGQTSCERCRGGLGCLAESDCTTGLICHGRLQRCALPGCEDGLKNGEESAVDCGGSTCGKCPVSKTCGQNSDCSSDVCSNGKCVSGLCGNDVKDPGETDVDCGGNCGGIRCGFGKACAAATDCKSNICVDNKCISDPCLDRVRNGEESDVDCGGTVCTTRCTAGKTCNAATDCVAGICNATTHRCAADQCHDGEKNGSEVDIDCGGSCADKCAVNRTCGADGDCASGVCNLVTTRCVPDRCFDGVKNGTETDLDCGGSCSPKCRAGKVCALGRDCQSGSCITGTGRCAADQCSDTRINGDETDVDCGGSCATDCAVGSGCLTGADCINPQGLVGVAGYCKVSTHACSETSCGDGVKDGDESGVDCGGSCAAKCAVGEGCLTADNCTSNFCNQTTGKCVGTRCEDGLKNGAETDVDCGSPDLASTTGCYNGCAVNKACNQPWDCQSGYCGTSGLCIPTVPRDCSIVFGNGDRTSGVKEIDPDGPAMWNAAPRRVTKFRSYSSGYFPPVGWNDTVLTYCDATRDGGGWTPAVYLNSTIDYLAWATPLMTNASWMITGECTSDTYCDQQNPRYGQPAGTSKCVKAINGKSYCLGRGPVRPDVFGLQAAPGTYATTTSPASVPVYGPNFGMRSFGMGVATVGADIAPSGRTSGVGGASGQATSYRWEAYRNGALVWSSGSKRMVNRLPTDGDGMVVRDMGFGDIDNNSVSSTEGWCQASAAYMGNAAVPEDGVVTPWFNANLNGFDSAFVSSGPPPLYARCGNFGTWTNVFGANSLNWVYARFYPTAIGQGRVDRPYLGLWTAIYGYPQGSANYSQYPQAMRFGLCNTFSRTTNCTPVIHPIGQYPTTFTQTELTDPNSGTELVLGTPGVVLTLWVK